MKILLISALSIAIVAGAFLIGYSKGIKTKSANANTALDRLDKRAGIKAQIAKDADSLIDYSARRVANATTKTAKAKADLEVLKSEPARTFDIVHLEAKITAMNTVIESQDAEIKALEAEKTQVYLARDAWKSAYEAMLNRVIAQDLAHQAAMAAERSSKIKIGCVSFGIGVLAGFAGKR